MPKLLKRGLFLFILVVLPVTVIMFLQLFGENKFDLPVFFDTEAPEIEGCNFLVPHIPDLPGSYEATRYGTVVAFLDSTEITPELERIGKLLSQEGVFSLKIFSTQVGNGVEQISRESFNYTLNCELAISSFTEDEVLIPVYYIDEQGRIRGFYKGEDKNDVDRLITELEIIERYYE